MGVNIVPQKFPKIWIVRNGVSKVVAVVMGILSLELPAMDQNVLQPVVGGVDGLQNLLELLFIQTTCVRELLSAPL